MKKKSGWRENENGQLEYNMVVSRRDYLLFPGNGSAAL